MIKNFNVNKLTKPVITALVKAYARRFLLEDERTGLDGVGTDKQFKTAVKLGLFDNLPDYTPEHSNGYKLTTAGKYLITSWRNNSLIELKDILTFKSEEAHSAVNDYCKDFILITENEIDDAVLSSHVFHSYDSDVPWWNVCDFLRQLTPKKLLFDNPYAPSDHNYCISCEQLKNITTQLHCDNCDSYICAACQALNVFCCAARFEKHKTNIKEQVKKITQPESITPAETIEHCADCGTDDVLKDCHICTYCEAVTCTHCKSHHHNKCAYKKFKHKFELVPIGTFTDPFNYREFIKAVKFPSNIELFKLTEIIGIIFYYNYNDPLNLDWLNGIKEKRDTLLNLLRLVFNDYQIYNEIKEENSEGFITHSGKQVLFTIKRSGITFNLHIDLFADREYVAKLLDQAYKINDQLFSHMINKMNHVPFKGFCTYEFPKEDAELKDNRLLTSLPPAPTDCAQEFMDERNLLNGINNILINKTLKWEIIETENGDFIKIWHLDSDIVVYERSCESFIRDALQSLAIPHMDY